MKTVLLYFAIFLLLFFAGMALIYLPRTEGPEPPTECYVFGFDSFQCIVAQSTRN